MTQFVTTHLSEIHSTKLKLNEQEQELLNRQQVIQQRESLCSEKEEWIETHLKLISNSSLQSSTVPCNPIILH